MNCEAKIYLLAIDSEERRILVRLPDSSLAAVENIKRVFGKNARVIAHDGPAKPIRGKGNGQQKLFV